jgi:hypothetical protein
MAKQYRRYNEETSMSIALGAAMKTPKGVELMANIKSRAAKKPTLTLKPVKS